MSDRTNPLIADAAYYALALQVHCRSVNSLANKDDAKRQMREVISDIDSKIGAAIRFHGADLKLVVLPEYFLTGHPLGESLEAWRDLAAIEPGGAEYEAIGAVAAKHKIFIGGNVYERDAHFPEIYFQACFLVAPSGETVLRSRRLISLFAPTPYDVWDKYLDIYGADSLFPVAKTEIGRIGAIASEEILYPEIARSLAVRGAEILIHPSSEAASNLLTIKNVAKLARAIENLAYVVSANSAGISGTPIARDSVDFGSKIIDYKGHVLSEAGYGESINAFGEIDLAAARRYRRRPGMGNILARQPLQLYADTYGGREILAPNGFLNNGAVKVPPRSYFIERQRAVIEKLDEAGLI